MHAMAMPASVRNQCPSALRIVNEVSCALLAQDKIDLSDSSYASACFLLSCQFRIDQDTTAVLTNDDLTTHTDLELHLRWDLVEATTAGVAVHSDYCQAVAIALTYFAVGFDETWFDLLAGSFGSLLKLLLLLLSVGYDLFELDFLDLEVLSSSRRYAHSPHRGFLSSHRS